MCTVYRVEYACTIATCRVLQMLSSIHESVLHAAHTIQALHVDILIMALLCAGNRTALCKPLSIIIY